MKATIEEIPRLTRNFSKPARTRVFKGGRGSGKTRGLAKRSAIRIYQLAEMGVEGVFLASREHLNSLDESSMEEIKAAIRSEPWLVDYFDIGEKYIRTKNRRISYAFAGLRHNLDSIKSKARIIGNWTDEAENVSEPAWRKLVNTLREEGNVEGHPWHVENWISYNPESAESATHKRFVESPAEDCIVTTINWTDNPFFPSILNKQRLEDQRLRPETYDHVWGGEFLTLTEAQIFAGKFVVEDFEPEPHWDGPYNGLDFGFAQDPTAAVQVYIHDRRLFVRREAGRTKLELDATSGFVLERIPGFDKHVTRADSARPESISYLSRHGLPRIIGVDKWKGSVEDGVEFIKSFEKVVIHTDCPQTAREFRLYSFKVDPRSGDIKPEIKDANNHYCIAEGELVTVRRGQVPIEAVTRDDEVLTRKGWRRVVFAGQTGTNRRTVEIRTTVGRLRCTPEHRVWTERGFVRADALRYADVVISTQESAWSSASNGTVGSIGAILKATGCRIGTIFGGRSMVEGNISTETSGVITTAKSQTALTFTTSTATPQTTPSKTLSAYPDATTAQNTRSKASGWRGKASTLIASARSPRLGTLARRGDKNTARSALWRGLALILTRSRASNAAVRSSPEKWAALIASVLTPARALGGGLPALMMRFANVALAAASSPLTDTQRPQLVRGRVLSVSDAGLCKRVYDLTIDGEPEFFVNGVLVHNCDAIRYALAPMIKRRDVEVRPMRR